MPRDYETLYYEAKASHTEANGMLWSELNAAKAEAERLTACLSEITRERDQERERVRLATVALVPDIEGHAYYNLMGVQTDLEWHFDGTGPITKADHTTVTRVLRQIGSALEALQEVPK